MKKIGIVSDLHLEGSNMEFNNPGWDILILAGDISVDFNILTQFFAYKCPSDIPIIYVLGNHEHEGKIKENVVPQLKEILKDFPNIHLLQNESIIIDNIKFIGTTLWTNFEGSGYHYKDEIKKWAQTNICDFSKVYTKTENDKYRKITPDDMEKDFKKAYNFLNYELKHNPFDGVKFVITHFAPSPQSIAPEYRDNMMNAYYVNNIENLLGFSDYWVHGHTHKSFNYNIEGTQVICNPRGASLMFNLDSNTSFDREMMVQISRPEDVPPSKIRIKP